MAAGGLSLHIAQYRSGMRQAPHDHGELHLSIVLRGTVTETIGGRTELLSPLSVVSKDPGVRHANAWGDDGAVLARLSITGLGLGDVAGDRRAAGAWHWSHDLGVAAPFLRLVRRASVADSRVDDDDADVADLVAALTSRRDRPTQPPAWLADAMALVRDGWRPGLTVGDVARHAGVHPVYLARSMRRWYGVTAGGELRSARMRHAVLALAAERGPVSGVAHASGFADEPHFCRSLRHSAGITPRRLRDVVRHARAIARPAGV